MKSGLLKHDFSCKNQLNELVLINLVKYQVKRSII
jgi:hypothetical protein